MTFTAILRDSGVANGRLGFGSGYHDIHNIPVGPQHLPFRFLRNEPTALNQLFLLRFAKRKGHARDVPETPNQVSSSQLPVSTFPTPNGASCVLTLIRIEQRATRSEDGSDSISSNTSSFWPTPASA